MNANILYRFGRYRVHPARRELWLDEEQVPVQPKAFDCLTYLIEHRDRVVGNDELIAAVWGRTDLSDNVVTHSIARARHAVGDTGDRQHAIKTVTRVGYSWNLPVEVSNVECAADADTHGRANEHEDVPDAGDANWRPNGNAERPAALAATVDIDAHRSCSEEPLDLAHAHEPCEAPSAQPVREASRSPRLGSSWRWLGFASAAALLATWMVSALWSDRSALQAHQVAGEAAIVLPVTVIGVGDGESSSAWIRLGVMDLIAERLREQGQLVIPSDNTVALARAYLEANGSALPGPEQIAALARTAAAGLVLGAQAETVGDHWRVSLHSVHGREPAVVAQGEAPDVLAAARAAADRMAVMLGFELLASNGGARADSQIDLALQQARAAMLSDQFDVAHRLLVGLDEDQRQDPRVRYELAAIEAQRGRLADAVASLTRLLDELPSSASDEFRAKVLYALGFTHLRQLDYERADQRYQEALDALGGRNSHEARQLTGRVLMSKAGLQALRNLLEEAEASFARARIALEISGDQLSLAKLDANMSRLYSQMGRAEAITHGERAVQRLEQFGDVQNELRARVHLALAHFTFENSMGAFLEAQRFDRLLAEVDNPALTNAVLVIKLGILVTSGRLDAAESLLKYLDDQPTGSSMEKERVQYFGAGLALVRGEYELAADLAEAAVQRVWEPAMYGEAAQAWRLLLRAQIKLGRAEQASQTIQAAAEWRVGIGDRTDVQTNMALMKAEYAAFVGDRATASESFEEALRLADQQSLPSSLVRVVGSYAEWLIEQGDLDRAGLLAGRVSIWADRSYGAALVQLRLYHAMGEAGGWRLALDRARTLAGERPIDAHLLVPPNLQVATTGQPQ